VHTLLDVTDTSKRLVQHGTVFAGIVVLLAARAVIDVWGLAATLVLIAVGLALFVVSSMTCQRWTVDYQGHAIAFENNPFRGEKLFIDGVLAAKGKIGVRSEMRAPIPSGRGAGDVIVVQSEAGLLRLRCMIQAMPASAGRASDAELLAEVRRRGLV
jgi:hypothetical protein